MLKKKQVTNFNSLGFRNLLYPNIYFGEWIPSYPTTDFTQRIKKQADPNQVLWGAELRNFTFSGRTFRAFEKTKSYLTFEPSFLRSYVLIKDRTLFEDFLDIMEVTSFRLNVNATIVGRNSDNAHVLFKGTACPTYYDFTPLTSAEFRFIFPDVYIRPTLF
jgi:hypothetical protein